MHRKPRRKLKRLLSRRRAMIRRLNYFNEGDMTAPAVVGTFSDFMLVQVKGMAAYLPELYAKR